MSETDPLKEIMDLKAQLAESCGYSLAKLASAAQKFSRGPSIIRPTASRKKLPDHPIGRSVAEDDDALRELRNVREKLWKEAGEDIHNFVRMAKEQERVAKNGKSRTEPRSVSQQLGKNRSKSTASFRSSKTKHTKTDR